MSARALLGLACLAALLAGCDRTAAGRDAYAAGRYAEALARFDAAAAEAGDDVPAELWYGQALSALAAGDPARAETAARRAIEAADPELLALSRFLLGNVAYARSLRAEAEARKPGADARAFQWAIAATEDALAAWRAAAATRDDWPAARRNVERALLRLEALRERRQTGGKGKPKPGDGKPPPDEPPKPDAPPPPPPPDDGGKDPDTAVAEDELPPSRVLGLFELLRAKEAAKRATRRAERRARASEVERDW